VELSPIADASPAEVHMPVVRTASPPDTRVPTLIRIVEADEEEQQNDSRDPSRRSSVRRRPPVAILVDGVARDPSDHAERLNTTLSSQVSVSLDSSGDLDAVQFHIGGSPMKPVRHTPGRRATDSAVRRSLGRSSLDAYADRATFRRAQLHRRALSGESSASASDDADMHMTTEETTDVPFNGVFCGD
jgi:hypothetical protein